MPKRVLNFILVAVLAFITVKATTFGWKFWSKSFMPQEKSAPLTENLKRHVYVLSHDIGDRSVYRYDKLEKAAQYITGEFSSYGYKPEFQEYTIEGKVCKNIIAVKKGTQRPDEIIILGAHYDTCFNSGADDNASAIAGLLETARIFSKQETARSIKFIAFVNEEPPFFQTGEMGSTVYAKAAKERGDDIKVAIILEMIGYYTDRPFSQSYPPVLGLFLPNKGNFIALVGNFASRQPLNIIKNAFGADSELPIEALVLPSFTPGVTFSDHYSFWQAGYKAVMFTDTAFYRNPNYHTNLDTYEKLHYEAMSALLKGLKAAVLGLTNGIY